MNNKERKFKSGTILTDGKHLIRIGYAYKPDWSPKNNYGRKHTEYNDCETYPKELVINNILTIRNDFYSNGIPGLWFQKGYHLENFMPINSELINPKLLSHV